MITQVITPVQERAIAADTSEPEVQRANTLYTKITSVLPGFEWPIGMEGEVGTMDVPIQLYLPDPGTVTDAEATVVVFTPGFLVQPEAYASYCIALASIGVPVVIYDKPGESPMQPMDDVSSAQLLLAVMDWCEAQPSLGAWKRGDGMGRPSAGTATAGSSKGLKGLQFTLSGHSRGGKISVLAAAADKRGGPRSDRVSSLVLLDPVDGSYDSVVGPR